MLPPVPHRYGPGAHVHDSGDVAFQVQPLPSHSAHAHEKSKRKNRRGEAHLKLERETNKKQIPGRSCLCEINVRTGRERRKSFEFRSLFRRAALPAARPVYTGLGVRGKSDCMRSIGSGCTGVLLRLPSPIVPAGFTEVEMLESTATASPLVTPPSPAADTRPPIPTLLSHGRPYALEEAKRCTCSAIGGADFAPLASPPRTRGSMITPPKPLNPPSSLGMISEDTTFESAASA